ncbi:MAG: hypothetical protein R2874_14745 [Desulfobacterales bacterium]
MTFEPGCINNWHTHKADKNGGQILLVTGGTPRLVQEKGKDARELHMPVMSCMSPPGLSTGMERLKTAGSFTLQWSTRENSSTEWHEPVDMNDYNKLK